MNDIFSMLTNMTTGIATQIQTFGIQAAFLVAVVCAIWYMTTSDEQNARRAKTWGFRIVVGLIIMVAALAIINGIVNYAGGITGTVVSSSRGV